MLSLHGSCFAVVIFVYRSCLTVVQQKFCDELTAILERFAIHQPASSEINTESFNRLFNRFFIEKVAEVQSSTVGLPPPAFCRGWYGVTLQTFTLMTPSVSFGEFLTHFWWPVLN